MSTKSPEGKAAFHASNAAANILGQLAKELEKEMKNLQRENEQNRENAIIHAFIKVMSVNGASQGSIQKAYPGLAEFAKYAVRRSAQENIALLEPSQSAPAEEAPGIPLTEV